MNPTTEWRSGKSAHLADGVRILGAGDVREGDVVLVRLGDDAHDGSLNLHLAVESFLQSGNALYHSEKLTWNSAPQPGWLRSFTFPPFCSAKRFTMERPMPVESSSPVGLALRRLYL